MKPHSVQAITQLIDTVQTLNPTYLSIGAGTMAQLRDLALRADAELMNLYTLPPTIIQQPK